MNAIDPAMIDGVVRSRRSAASLALLPLALLAFTLLVRSLGFVPAVINPDENIFALAAREVLNGHLPYLTLFDNKPVGSTLILAFTTAVLGNGIVALRIVGALCVWASALGLAVIGGRTGLPRYTAIAVAALYIAFTPQIGGMATLTEILLTPWTILAVLLLQRQLGRVMPFTQRLWLALAAGLACGAAILIKIVPVLPGAAVATLTLALLVHRRTVSPARGIALLAVFAVGSAAPMLGAAAVYAEAGHLAEFVYSNVGFARYYAGVHPGASLTAQRLGTAFDALWPLLVAATVGVIGIVAARRDDGATAIAPAPGSPDLLLIALAWLAGEVAAASASLQFYPHYFLVAVPPLCLLAGLAFPVAADWLGIRRKRWKPAVLLAAAMALIGIERAEVDTARDLVAGKDQSRRIAAAIRADGVRHPTLFVTDYQLSVLYSLIDAPLPPTRYAIAPHLLSRQSAMVRSDPAVEIARVLASRPTYIVINAADRLPRWAAPQIARALARDYRPLFARRGVTVFRVVTTGPIRTVRAPALTNVSKAPPPADL